MIISKEEFEDIYSKLALEQKKQLLKQIGVYPKTPEIVEYIEDSRMYTVKDVADLLGYTVQHVRRLCKQGKIPAIQHMDKGKYLILGQHIKEFFDTYSYRETLAKRFIKENALPK